MTGPEPPDAPESADAGAAPAADAVAAALHPEIEAQFSDLYEHGLDRDQRETVEAHLSDCAACRGAYEDFRETMAALTGLKQMAAPNDFERDVEERIRRRSAGRFFGRKAFGDRIPYELLAIAVIVLGLVVTLLIRSSRTGSLHYQESPEAPQIAPGAGDVVPKPDRAPQGLGRP